MLIVVGRGLGEISRDGAAAVDNIRDLGVFYIRLNVTNTSLQ